MAFTDDEWEAETRRLQREGEYWQKRSERLALAQEERAKDYVKELAEQYDIACRNVQKEIEAWYTRFANEEGITLQEAKKLLTKKELKEFKMDVNEYIDKGRTLNYSSQFAKELERASTRVHVERLEALQLQMRQQVEELMSKEVAGLEKLLSETYSEGYYWTAFNIQQGLGYGRAFQLLDKKMIDKVLAKPWTPDDLNFYGRVWQKHAPQMINYLQTDFTQGIIQGKDPKKMVSDVSKRFDVGKSTAGRLIMTESAYFASTANGDCMNGLGVKEYEILATLDNKTSEICQAMDGHKFPMTDFEVGVTAPPFHMWCRTTTVPYFDDEFTEGEQRAARDEDGNYYTVPANMRYPEWKEKETLEFFKASLNKRVDREPVPGELISKKDYMEFNKAMESAGYKIEGFENYRGDHEFLKKLQNEFESIASKYPEESAGLKIVYDTKEDMGKDTLGWYNTRTGEIHINKLVYDDTDFAEYVCRTGAEKGIFPPETDARYVAWHEFGHRYGSYHGINNKEIVKEIYRENSDIMPNKYGNTKLFSEMLNEHLSKNAGDANSTTHPTEMFDETIADCFAEWYNSSKPRWLCEAFLRKVGAIK